MNKLLKTILMLVANKQKQMIASDSLNVNLFVIMSKEKPNLIK